jgi:hypothetical protein
MKKVLDLVAWLLVVIGALNWGLIGVFNGFNLVTALFGNGIAARVVYILVGVAAIWKIFSKLTKKKRK